MPNSSKRFIRCPNCGTNLDGLTVVRYDQPFRCPNCKVELHVPKHYKLVIFWLALAIDLTLCLGMRMRDGTLAMGLLIFLLPSLFSVGIFIRKIIPPKVVVYRDPNSILT
jgi:hypothetical protein